MLAQNFKSADELRLTEAQYNALKKTLVLMETGKIKHVDNEELSYPIVHFTFTGHFNMNEWLAVGECGTIACIGGTAELVGGLRQRSLSNAAERNHDLNCLFYPPRLLHWNKITVTQAAHALRSYLTTGEAEWKT